MGLTTSSFVFTIMIKSSGGQFLQMNNHLLGSHPGSGPNSLTPQVKKYFGDNRKTQPSHKINGEVNRPAKPSQEESRLHGKQSQTMGDLGCLCMEMPRAYIE